MMWPRNAHVVVGQSGPRIVACRLAVWIKKH